MSMVNLIPTLQPLDVNHVSKPPPKAAPRKGKVHRKSRTDGSDPKGKRPAPAKPTKRASILTPVLSPQDDDRTRLTLTPVLSLQDGDDRTTLNERVEVDTLLVTLFSTSFYNTG